MEQQFCFDEARFTYLVSEQPNPLFSQHTPIAGGALVVSHTAQTQVLSCREGDREITLIGFCVDAHGELSREQIPQAFLDRNFPDPESAYRFFDRFAGKYVVIACWGSRMAVWGDASCSVPVHYCLEAGNFCLSCLDHLAAEVCGKGESPLGLSVRLGSDLGQGMPNDLTLYEDIRALLANHYLDLETKQAVRVSMDTKFESLDAVVKGTDFLVSNIVREYRRHYEMVCPLTSGYDSRIVYAFLKEQIPDLNCYTFLHPGFTLETDDIRIPETICGLFGTKRHLIADLTAPESYRQELFRYMGSRHSARTINLAYTYLSRWKGTALVNGDIIGQIGKSVLGNTIPNRVAGPRYFQCKIHNIAPAARKEMKAYLEGIRKAGQMHQVYDLFALENRCGRWAGQTAMIYSLCGIDSLNIVNCRELLRLWIGVPREIRVANRIHAGLLTHKDPQLMTVPFNPDGKWGFMKKHWTLFYLATFLKFYAQLLRSRLRPAGR